jgi:hypothetical protein
MGWQLYSPVLTEEYKSISKAARKIVVKKDASLGSIFILDFQFFDGCNTCK